MASPHTPAALLLAQLQGELEAEVDAQLGFLVLRARLRPAGASTATYGPINFPVDVWMLEYLPAAPARFPKRLHWLWNGAVLAMAPFIWRLLEVQAIRLRAAEVDWSEWNWDRMRADIIRWDS